MPAPLVRIAGSAVHGQGVYAAEDIPDGTRVLEYLGERITKRQSREREKQRLRRAARGGDASVYIFTLNRRHDLDGRTRRNHARWVNHSCNPNCRAEIIRGKIWIIARRDIPGGAELSFDYGFPYREWPLHPCRCGAERCPGFIVNAPQRWLVRKALRRRRKPAVSQQLSRGDSAASRRNLELRTCRKPTHGSTKAVKEDGVVGGRARAPK